MIDLKSRQMIIKEEVFNHRVPVQIRLNDVDMNRHVNNSMYHHYFDFARVRYFEQMIGSEIQWDYQSMVAANITIDFYEPVYLNDEVEVWSKVIRIGHKSIVFLQYLISLDGQNIKARNQAVMVGFNPTLKQSFPVPADWKQGIERIEGQGF